MRKHHFHGQVCVYEGLRKSFKYLTYNSMIVFVPGPRLHDEIQENLCAAAFPHLKLPITLEYAKNTCLFQDEP